VISHNGRVDARQAEVLATIDPALLGRRLRAARVAAGLTQGQIAGNEVTVGYVSRIESGQRRPDGKVLQLLADRVGASLDALLLGVTEDKSAAFRLELDFADIALQSGDPGQALTRIDALLHDSADKLAPGERVRAHLIRSGALESTGQLDDAILALEAIVKTGREQPGWLRSSIALSRCYREAGDLARAIQAGEAALASLDEELAASDEAIQLVVTVAAAYFEHGDTGYAIRLCKQVVERSETSGSREARAAAYWNVSVMESQTGSVAAAIPLAERALALLGEGEDDRNLARLRSQLGVMQLQSDPPMGAEALANLGRAAAELKECQASPIDVARNDVALARALFYQGELGQARALASATYDAAHGTAPLLAADARALEGQILAAEGEWVEAKAAYQDAVMTLTGVGADRSAAQLWLELGGALAAAGDDEAAGEAYRNAAVSSGLRPRRSAEQISRTL
jgi:transcriptional regulator with XRE-family HTH domain